MVSSEFWHTLGEKFRSIFDPASQLYAKWKHPTTDPADTRWEIGGEASDEERNQFLTLSRFAGSKLVPDSLDPLRVWLNKLKNSRPEYDRDTREFTQSGGGGFSFEFGTVREICRASANLCDELELVALVSITHPEVNAPAKTEAPSHRIEPDLDELRSLAIGLDGQDAILLDGIRTVPGYEVSEAQWEAVASVLRDIFAKLPDLTIPLELHSQPYALRSQISVVRAKIQRKIDLLERSQVGVKVKTTAEHNEQQALLDNYLGSFQEKIMILDICWAAKQRYREWTRWIGGDLKETSKAAMAFRAVLTSGQRPEKYRPEPRPKGWK